MNELTCTHLFAQVTQYGNGSGGIAAVVIVTIWLAVAVIVIAGLWQTFAKADKPGWAAIVPIYNIVVLLQIAGRPIWWIILFFIPLVNCVVGIVVSIDVAKNFGKGVGFGLGLAFFGFLFYPILGFGSARYEPTS